MHDNLLQHAKLLIGGKADDPRVREVELRRAVSAAYYAVFHLIVHDTVRMMCPWDDARELRNNYSRSFDHAVVRKVAANFVGTLPMEYAPILKRGVPQTIKEALKRFVKLYDDRQRADYDLAMAFAETDAADSVGEASKAFGHWRTSVASHADELRIFMTAICVTSQDRRR